MKLIKIFTIGIILLSIQAISTAISPSAINEPMLVNDNFTEQIKQNDSGLSPLYSDKFGLLTKRYEKNLRQCVPAHFNQYLDLFGFKLSINIDINGWIDNKCEYKASANIPSLGDDIRQVYGLKISDEQLSKIKPVGQCQFNQDQLNIAVDALLSAPKESSKLSKTNKNREKTPEEEKFMAMLTTEKVCKFLNKEEVLNQIQEIFMQNP